MGMNEIKYKDCVGISTNGTLQSNLVYYETPLLEKIKHYEQQLQAYKDKEDKLREYCEARLEIAKRDCVPARSFTLQDILQILNEGSDK